jgi:DNA-directed RNA polymerase specialized sigma subunit
MEKQSNRPWLDQSGEIFSDEIIREISKKWTPEVWENFLASTVDAEVSEHEAVLHEYSEICEEQTYSIFGTSCSVPQVVKNDIKSSVQKLRKRPRIIIRRHYWKNMPLRKIAILENLPTSRIHKIKNDSLNKIKVLLEKSVNTSSYLIEGDKKNDANKTRDEDIRATYSMDLKGRYLSF